MTRGLLTVAKVRRRVREIERHAVDYEVAHGMEDALHADVLSNIADGTCEDPRGCAAEALKTLAINFRRMCA